MESHEECTALCLLVSKFPEPGKTSFLQIQHLFCIPISLSVILAHYTADGKERFPAHLTALADGPTERLPAEPEMEGRGVLRASYPLDNCKD